MTTYASLREFVDALDRAGELVRVSQPVSPRLEIAALADVVMKAPGGGKALLFENVVGSDMPVLINAFGSRRRMDMALGTDDVEEIPHRIEGLLKTAPPQGLADTLRLLPTLFQLRGVPPRRYRGRPPCQEVVLRGEAVDSLPRSGARRARSRAGVPGAGMEVNPRSRSGEGREQPRAPVGTGV